jgi:prolipoprotein diacylglyceryltransferase
VTAVESLLVALRKLPFPGAWLTLELFATFLSCLCFFRHTRDFPELRRVFLLALPVGLAFALGFGALFRFSDFLAFGGPADFTGVSAFGALAGTCLGFGVLVRRAGWEVPSALDRLAPALLLLLGVGRVGCFAAGCDGGVVSSVPWAIRFPRGSQIFRDQVARGLLLSNDHHSLAVHPTQLYEVLIVLPGALVLGAMLRKGRAAPGRVFFAAALVYGVARLLADSFRAGYRGLNYGQGMALLLLIAAALCLRLASPRDTRERRV